MNILLSEPLPRWYGLSWDMAIPAIRVWAHPEFARTLAPISGDGMAVRNLRKELDLLAFQGGFDDSRFGFEGALRLDHTPDGALEFLAPLPRVRYRTQRRCSDCHGSREDRIGKKRPCYHCDGTGLEHEYRWRRAEAVAASLGLLLVAMEYPDRKTSDLRPQFLTAHGFPNRGSCCVGGMFSESLVRLLESLPPFEGLVPIEAAMRTACQKMLGPMRAGRSGFRAYATASGALSLDCPAGSIYTLASDGPATAGRGREFSCTDVVTPEQQLMLFAGLAAFHDFADQAMMLLSVPASAC